jgi:hypothetical protein
MLLGIISLELLILVGEFRRLTKIKLDEGIFKDIVGRYITSKLRRLEHYFGLDEDRIPVRPPSALSPRKNRKRETSHLARSHQEWRQRTLKPPQMSRHHVHDPTTLSAENHEA